MGSEGIPERSEGCTGADGMRQGGSQGRGWDMGEEEYPFGRERKEVFGTEPEDSTGADGQEHGV